MICFISMKMIMGKSDFDNCSSQPDKEVLQLSSLQKQRRISTSTDLLPWIIWTASSSRLHPGSKAYMVSAHPRKTGAVLDISMCQILFFKKKLTLLVISSLCPKATFSRGWTFSHPLIIQTQFVSDVACMIVHFLSGWSSLFSNVPIASIAVNLRVKFFQAASVATYRLFHLGCIRLFFLALTDVTANNWR